MQGGIPNVKTYALMIWVHVFHLTVASHAACLDKGLVGTVIETSCSLFVLSGFPFMS